MCPRSLHLAILDCDTPVSNVLAKRGLFSTLFKNVLEKAAERRGGVELSFSVYDAVRGELPLEKDLKLINGVIITGSSFSAYDDLPWIAHLTRFIRNLYINSPNIRIFGSCFGHQVLCTALFASSSHRIVFPDPSGWELGIHSVTLSAPFLANFGPVISNPSSPSELRLQFVHRDHVRHPVEHEMWVKERWVGVGKTEGCAFQGVWRKGRVLTLQGHVEFDEWINEEIISVFLKGLEEGALREARERVKGEDDKVWAAEVILKFFVEENNEEIRQWD